jgi:hypothetical protein
MVTKTHPHCPCSLQSEDHSASLAWTSTGTEGHAFVPRITPPMTPRAKPGATEPLNSRATTILTASPIAAATERTVSGFRRDSFAPASALSGMLFIYWPQFFFGGSRSIVRLSFDGVHAIPMANRSFLSVQPCAAQTGQCGFAASPQVNAQVRYTGAGWVSTRSAGRPSNALGHHGAQVGR